MKKLIFSLMLTLVALTGISTTAQRALAADPPVPTTEQRLATIEAYFANTDPAATLKDKDGNIPTGLTTAAASNPGPGHNGFQMICAALVLFMTLPGLFLFYGGLVRRKNILSVVAQCFGIAGVVTILWVLFGYSFVFGDGSGAWWGSYSKFAFLKDVTGAPNTNYSAWVSHNVFAMYQLMFAIITPALIVGAIAERMRFASLMLFVIGWMIIVYFPLAHWVWGIDGVMNGVWNAKAQIKAIDFAGGTVVHMSSGWSALVLCLILGPRMGFGKQPMPPHSMVLCAVGTGMLWVGWYGFNAGSAVAADVVAAQAFTTTTIATAVASIIWPLVEWFHRGKPSILGFCSGAVAGLVVVTPACGFVTAKSAFIIGILAGVVPYFACAFLKPMLKYDDALDTFGVHAVGGTLGAFVTGIFADASVNGNLNTNLKDIVGKTLWIEQLKAIGITIALAVIASVVLGFLVKAILGLRPTAENETTGLDVTDHGEEGYNY